MERTVEFRSTARNLTVWVEKTSTTGFTKQFVDGALLVTEEDAEIMRKSRQYRRSYFEVKKGEILPPRPASLDPVIRSDNPKTPAISPQESEFKESFAPTTEEFSSSKHVSVNFESEDVPAPSPAPQARQPIKKAIKENTDVQDHKGA